MQQPEFDHLPETFVRYGLPTNLSSSLPTPDNLSSADCMSSANSANSLGGDAAPLDQFDLSPNVSSDTFIELLVEAWRGEENSKQEANQQAYSQLEQELQEACDQLILAHQKIQIQETTMESLEAHIILIEQELETKVSLLAQAELEKEDLRDRLRRQHHHTSQLKAALEKRVETVNTGNNPISGNVIPMERSLKSVEREDEFTEASISSTPVPIVESLNSLADLVAFKAESKLEPKSAAKPKSEARLNLATVNFKPEPKLEPGYELRYELNNSSSLPHLGSPTEGQTTVIEIIQTVSNPEITPNSDHQNGRSLRSLADVQTNDFPKLSQISPLSIPSTPSALPQSAIIPGKQKALNSLSAVQLPKFPPLRRK